jgi:nitroreductase
MEQFEAYKAIQERISVRSYSSRPVEAALRRELEEYIENIGGGPFGIEPRFRMLDMEPLDKKELRGLGTYGFIKNARLYILSAVDDKPGAMEDLGYCLEKAILKAASLGLGTCWLGGTFKRAAFARKMEIQPGELLPAITPVGYPADETNHADHMIRKAVKAKKRKPWAELFFGSDGKTALSKEEAGQYRDPLEAVRLGPSASNRQPWRMIRDDAGLYHLYLMESKIYNRIMGRIRLQNVDMGIAMCHFEMVAREQNLSGKWTANPAGAPAVPGLQYIATWSG